MQNQFDDIDKLGDIPGTTVFTMQMARKGFDLNQFCMSLMREENRQRFLADERAYLQAWQLTESQRAAVLSRDYSAMVAEGGNIYFLVKIGATDGASALKVVASMTDMTSDAYAAMMLAGGRRPHSVCALEEQG